MDAHAPTADGSAIDGPQPDWPATRVAIVARTPRTSKRLHALVDSTDDLAVVAEVPGFRGAVEQVFAFQPHVLVVETVDNGVDALELTRLVVARGHPRPPGVLLLLSGTEPAALVRALWRGARGVVIASGNQDLLVDAIRLVGAGYLVVPPALRRDALESTASQQLASLPDLAALDRLTPRELDVMKLVAAGRSNADISAELRLSESTVKSYVQRVFDKLGVHNRAGIVIRAYQAGLCGRESGPPD
jgi:DNA-binding NarL/FixJ family response regulator